MTATEKNKYVDEVNSWIKDGLNKNEAKIKLREKGVGLVSADTIVNKSYNSLISNYSKDFIKALNNNAKVNIQDFCNQAIPSHLTEEFAPILIKKYSNHIKDKVIHKLHIEDPINDIFKEFESDLISKSQLRTWIKSYYGNLNSRERRVKRNIVSSGVFLLLMGVILGLVIEFSPSERTSIRYLAYTIGLMIIGVVNIFYGFFKSVSDIPKI